MPVEPEVVLFDSMYLANDSWFPCIRRTFAQDGSEAGYRPAAWSTQRTWEGDEFPTVELATLELRRHLRAVAGYDVMLRNLYEARSYA